MLAVAVVLLVACQPGRPSPSPQGSPAVLSASPSSTPFAPVFNATECPDDVTVVMVVVPTCGYLTVPERRDRPDGPMIQIFVVRIEPSEGLGANDAMVAVGETLGGQLEYGGLAPLAQRTGRVAYLVDRRGTGFSEPNLGCPEISAAAPAARALATGDASTDLVVSAIRACRERLVASGVDLSAYDLAASARDIEDLRVALGLGPWNVIAFGSASRLALEVGRIAPEGVRTIVLDSPVLPEGPDPMFAGAAAAKAIDELDAACAAMSACHDAFPDVAGLIEAAAGKLDRSPLTLASTDSTNGSETVVDGTRLARAVRSILATDGGRDIARLLPSLRSAVDGAMTSNDPVARRASRDDGLCLGYVPNCDAVVYGSLLTTVCRDVLPFVDRRAVPAIGAQVPGVDGVFASNPYVDACAAWDVPPADASVARPMRSDLPVLAMVGQFDPFSGPIDVIEAGLAGVARATVVEVPGQSYNVLGFNECPRLVRGAWINDPDAPLDTGCFASMPAVRPSTELVSP